MILDSIRETSGDVSALQDALREGWTGLRLLLRTLLGKPTETKRSNCTATWEDIVVCDPTDGAITVTLPEIVPERVGSVLLVVNNSSDTNNINLQPVASQTVNGADAGMSASTAWGITVLVPVERAAWVGRVI